MAGFNPNRSMQQNSAEAALGSTVQNKSFWSKVLRDMSTWGMSFDDMIVKNSVAVNANEDPNSMGDGINTFDRYTRRANAMMNEKKPIAYNDTSYPEKRRVLRDYALKDQIGDYVSKVCDAAIVYQKNKRFCQVTDLSNAVDATMQAKLQENFEKIYNAYEFDDSKTGWDAFRQFLIDGHLCYEIVYDDWRKNVIGFNQIDVTTIVHAIDPISKKKVWVQYPENPTERRVLLDAQIVYISYQTSAELSETSYVEPLIKPYNQLKMLEHTKILFNMQHATMHKQFTIPTKGMPGNRAKQELAQAMADFHDDVVWDDVMGTVTIDGRQHIPYSKEYWWPEGDAGSPKMEIVDPGGHNLNENDMLKWFYDNLKRASKIPFTWLDKDNSGGNMYAAAGDVTHDDDQFNRFIGRMRAIFREIIIKPLTVQMVLDYPEMKNDDNFRSDINIEYMGDNQFEEWAHINNLKARAEAVGVLNSNLLRAEDKPMLHPLWMMKNIMGFTQEMIDENERYFLIDAADTGAAGSGGGGGGGPEGSGAGGGGDDSSPAGDAGGGDAPVDDLGGDAGALTDPASDAPAGDTAQPGGDSAAQPVQ